MFLPLLLGTIAGIISYDFFFNKKHGTTDFKKVKELYRVIRHNKHYPKPGICNSVINSMFSVKELITIVIRIQKDKFNTYTYSPTRLDESFIYVKYYTGSRWYNGIIYHPTRSGKKTHIMRIKTRQDGKVLDIKKHLEPFMGPEKNFYGQKVKPSTFKMHNMIIEKTGDYYDISSTNKTEYVYEHHDIISV